MNAYAFAGNAEAAKAAATQWERAKAARLAA
jgi:hypothetical protein